MRSEDKYFDSLNEEQLWQRYCGFIDLSVNEFMTIQEGLLLDQIDKVADSVLGKKIINNQKPKSVDEFRQMVPLTTYKDYEPYLSEQREDVLAMKPYTWSHSSGRRGNFKWIPYSSEFLDRVARSCVGTMILATSRRKGEVRISPGCRILLILAPPPYVSGTVIETLARYFSFSQMPPAETVGKIEFPERIQLGFQMALRDGVDAIGALASILVRMGEQFSEQSRRTKFNRSMLHPKVLSRLLRAVLRSKRERRTILPKDLWPSKAVMTGGVDTAIYRKDIANYWGCEPYEFYICAEACYIATQGLNTKGMIFFPDHVFLEFIPHEEEIKHQDDKEYQPRTVLIDELEEGQLYEVVITHFYGMPLLRYRMRDLVRVTTLGDGKRGNSLPQIVFQRRVGETINLAGLADLDEKTIWQAIANTGVKYVDWAACKEYDQNRTFLRLYIELKEEKKGTELEKQIDKELKAIDIDYQDIGSQLDLQPVRITLLSRGTFDKYIEERRKEGASPAHLKPDHINAPQSIIDRLIQLSQ